MCDPITALTIGATAVSAAGSVVSGIQQQKQANYQAQVDNINAQMASQARREAIDQGVVNQVREDRKAAQIEGAQRASLASSGVDTSYATAVSLQGDNALIASENRQDIVTNTDRQAQGYAINAMNYMDDAVAAKAKGANALTNSIFQATGTILGGASQVAKQNQFKTGRNAYGIAGSENGY